MTKFKWSLPNQTNIALLKISGIWPEDATFQYNLYYLYKLTAMICFIYPHNICQIINLFYINDLTVAGAIIFVILSELIATIKMHCVTRHLKTLKRLTEDIKHSEMLQPQNEAQEQAVMVGINFWTKSFRFFFFSGLVTYAFWAVFPILDGGYKEYKLPFIAWYPYDYRKSPYYELTYVHQMMSIIFLGNINLGVDSFSAALLTFVGAQCDILCDKLRNLHLQKNVREGFVDCVKHHLRIIRYAEDTSNFVDLLILLQFVSSSVSFGLTLFQLNVVTPFTGQFYSFLTYGAAIILEIFMYCWFGNEVELRSSNIPYAAYESNWTKFPKSLKNDLIFFILRTQSTIKFSAMDLFYISLETFVRILRTGWSYFALMSTINT